MKKTTTQETTPKEKPKTPKVNVAKPKAAKEATPKTEKKAGSAKKAASAKPGVKKKALAPKKTSAKKPAAKKPAPKKTAVKKPAAKKKAVKKTAAKKATPKKKAAAKKTTASSDKALVKFDPLQRYLNEISRYGLITREKEKELGIKIQEHGDREAAYVLATSNLRLVVKIALEFQKIWMQNLLDLIQEGNIGLMHAVKKFDPYKNVKFSYYSSFWIKAYILKFIMDNWRLVKIGTTQGQRKLFFKLKKEKQRLIDEGFDPKPKLLSERLGVSEREIVDMDQRLDGWDLSLDAPVKEDSNTERMELLETDSESVEEQMAKKEMKALLHEKIDEFSKQMTPRESEIFTSRIFSDTPATLQQIGDKYQISRERVRQIEKNIIKKMRDYFRNEISDFDDYTTDD